MMWSKPIQLLPSICLCGAVRTSVCHMHLYYSTIDNHACFISAIFVPSKTLYLHNSLHLPSNFYQVFASVARLEHLFATCIYYPTMHVSSMPSSSHLPLYIVSSIELSAAIVIIWYLDMWPIMYWNKMILSTSIYDFKYFDMIYISAIAFSLSPFDDSSGS